MIKKELIERLVAEFSELKRVLFRSVVRQQEPFVSQTQKELLFLIAKNITMTMSQIAQELHVTGSAGSQLVDTLVGLNLIERLPDKTDRRIVHILLSDNGKKQIEKLKSDYLRGFENIMNKLDTDELETLLELISKMNGKV